jgi:septation ring formation regulator EzrA
VALFSEDLKRLQDLEVQYRKELAEYQAEAAEYRTLLEHKPDDPDLPKRYEQLEAKNKQVQETYAKLERLRRMLSPGSGASSGLA